MWLLLLLIIHCVLTATINHENILVYKCKINADGKCVCPFGYRLNDNYQCIFEKNELRDRRQINYGMRMLGEECEWINQCRRTPVDGTKICLSHKCQCSNGYIPIDAYRCIQDFEHLSPNARVTKAMDIELPGFGSMCSTNSDCRQITIELECLRGICVCLQGYVPLGKYVCYNIHGHGVPLIESSTITPVLPSETSVVQPMNNEVLKSLGKIGNSCTNDYFCRRTVSQSHCFNGKCTCIDSFIPIDQYTCMKNINEATTTMSTLSPADYKSLLGGNCLTKRNCHTSNAICLNATCSCPKGYFPVDDWTCLQEPESSDEELTETTSIISTTTATTKRTSTLSTTTVFRWWPWSPSPSTRPTYLNIKNAFRVRCLINRQCASMDKNSHCTLFGRCICNRGYQLETTNRGQRCVQRIRNEDDCD